MYARAFMDTRHGYVACTRCQSRTRNFLSTQLSYCRACFPTRTWSSDKFARRRSPATHVLLLLTNQCRVRTEIIISCARRTCQSSQTRQVIKTKKRIQFNILTFILLSMNSFCFKDLLIFKRLIANYTLLQIEHSLLPRYVFKVELDSSPLCTRHHEDTVCDFDRINNNSSKKLFIFHFFLL